MSSFSKGWDVVNKGNSKAKKRLYGTLATIATLLTETYGGCSIYFGSIAFQQGLKDLEESGTASIIGHWSEWTNQGLLVINLPIIGPYRELTAVGNRKQVEKIFKLYLLFRVNYLCRSTTINLAGLGALGSRGLSRSLRA